ncbi:hypothetical protein PMZ80_003891 [Knufia obscura]|uniref:DUF7514 domain-containing protein n=1 Tax=Knufia obscura TaxID=1635080 RepID=A0ABR0RVI5_9EURO|nr:hypothetical protein PMZ80_003891 [Knufia obscura]
MSNNNDNRSFSPANGLNGRQERLPQNYQDPRISTSEYGSPVPRMPRTGYQPLAPVSVNGGTQGTAPSLSYPPPRQPINEAVTSAVNTTDSNLSPELIQLITQNVIQQLHTHKPTVPPSAQPVQSPSNPLADQSDIASSLQGSPIAERATVYTPPPSYRPEDKRRESMSMPTTHTVNAFGYETARKEATSPFSRASTEEAVLSDAESRSSRPEAPRRSSTDGDATVLEKYWGKLFDEQGQSTERLQHFLEGIALQLIENYEPKHSLVITPDKMQKFYEDTRLDNRVEIYPWKLIFDDKTSSISRLLREKDIQVQHHLIQPALDARPDIPGLTPFGFASWMTMLIKAHPDHEHERLAKALKVMAVSHPQERGQRFPAAISRRLFPARGDETISARLTELMAAHCKVQLSSRHNSTAVPADMDSKTEAPQSPRRADVPPAPTVEDAADESEKPAQQPKDSGVSFTAEPTKPKFRDMPSSDPESTKAYSVTSIEDESDVPTPQPPIERQRQPYVAQPGGGKTYGGTAPADKKVDQTQTQPPDTSDMRRTKSVSNPQRPRVPPPIAIHQRPDAQPPQPDGAELSRSRSNVVSGQNPGSMHRTRSNSTHEREARPFRRTRSNSTYANDAGPRYHPQRSPSFSKSGVDFQNPRATDSTINYPTYATSNSGRPGSTYHPSTADRYEYARHPTHDPRDSRYEREKSRDRTHDARSRPRFQTAPGPDAYPSPDDYYRSQQAYANANGVSQPAGGPYQYPPTAYRDGVR